MRLLSCGVRDTTRRCTPRIFREDDNVFNIHNPSNYDVVSDTVFLVTICHAAHITERHKMTT